MRNARSWLQAHATTGYLPWLIALPLALSSLRVVTLPVPLALHYLASFGPLLAALLVTAAIGGRSGIRDLLASMTRWQIGWRWWAVAVGPVGLFAFAALVARLVEGAWPDLHDLGKVNFLGDVGAPAAVVLWLATFGFGEETGWRGFALPHLQRRRTAVTATIIVAVMWAVWHAPYWFYLPGYVRMGVAGVPGFVIGLVLGAVLLTWLYNGTAGSIPAVAVWHALFDFFSGSQAADGLMNGVMSTLIVVWAVAILLFSGLRSGGGGPRGVERRRRACTDRRARAVIRR